ncbi:putative extracellular chitosanase CsnC [Talaromyces proteolyticus]|uniref:Endo-chitosanase n=1 Tax=Talaromyces proteolyticus TaxID=1131652 RepID=A0AAD4KX69_9EURO|nr:putative extracellular chitosanase CsnC [Talaromyces proteolyticus]KAH8698868.1 putative extracellular chitosanase CsnC [Talaromyces proteolyticus]
MSLRTAILAASCLSSIAFGQTVDGSSYNKPSGGPPASFFAAASTINVGAVKTAVAHATGVPKKAVYDVNGASTKVTIHDDYMTKPTGAAIVYVSNMNVDCDGIDYKCKGNPDGQSDTDNGELAAYEVPWVVIPENFQKAYPDILPGNNVAAVICNDKMFYGIYGDSDGDTPEDIGEASWLMARTCFPDEDLNGNSGHDALDVTYIVFVGKDSILPDSAVNSKYITDFTKLRSMGNKLMTAFESNIDNKTSKSNVFDPKKRGTLPVPFQG